VPVTLEADLSTYAQFGWSVSLSGDTLVVGAPADDAPGKSSGLRHRVRVRGRDLVGAGPPGPDDGGAFDDFGHAVAVDGDTALIGAPYDSSTGTYFGGAAYLFVRSGSTWTQQARLDLSYLRYDGVAGWSVALEGDTAVVGQPGGGVQSRGAANVFTRSGTTWTERAVLQDVGLEPLDGFGSAVAIDAGTIVVGQVPTSYSSGTEHHQSAYVYVGSAPRGPSRRFSCPPISGTATGSECPSTSVRTRSSSEPMTTRWVR